MLTTIELNFLPEINTGVVGGSSSDGGCGSVSGWLGQDDDKNESGGGIKGVFFLGKTEMSVLMFLDKLV